MSAAANWSHTATATLWPWLGRDDWSGAETFGTPQLIACDYAVKAERRTDDLGVEFVTRMVVYTERAGIKRSDRILLGDHLAQANPLAVGALQVRAVHVSADVFDRHADDVEVLT